MGRQPESFGIWSVLVYPSNIYIRNVYTHINTHIRFIHTHYSLTVNDFSLYEIVLLLALFYLLLFFLNFILLISLHYFLELSPLESNLKTKHILWRLYLSLFSFLTLPKTSEAPTRAPLVFPPASPIKYICVWTQVPFIYWDVTYPRRCIIGLERKQQVVLKCIS